MPKVVPPMLNRIITTGMSRMSLPLSFLMTRLMPALMALVLVRMAKEPPISRTKATTSLAC